MIRPLFLALAVACGGDTPGDTATTGTPGDTDPGPTGPTSAQADVRINEIVASNATGLQDEGGAYPDWIELYNAGDEAVDLEGFAMSEEEGWKDQWVFPAGVTIEAGGYVVVLADGDTGEGALHANFKLSGTGETVWLFGREVDGSPWLDHVDFPELLTDTSWARDASGAWAVDDTPTPGATNE